MNSIGQDLELSVRSSNLARRIGVSTVGELVLYSEEEILETGCFSETSLQEIKAKLAARGLRLGMHPSEVQGQAGLQGNIVRGQPAGTHPGDSEPEGPCCGHCEDATRRLREQVAARAADAKNRPKGNSVENKLNMSLVELELSVRATNCLESAGIVVVRDLVIRTPGELMDIPNFAATTLREVQSKLGEQGLQLEMLLPPG